MKVLKIGDKVKVVNEGKRYEKYGSWFDENGCGVTLRNEYEDTCQNNNVELLTGCVVAKGIGGLGDVDICAVRLDIGGLILIGEEGLQLNTDEPLDMNEQPLKLYQLFEYYKEPSNKSDKFVGENGEIYHFKGGYIFEDDVELTDAKHSLSIFNDEVYPYDDAKEMTIEEIQEILGHKVTIVE